MTESIGIAMRPLTKRLARAFSRIKVVECALSDPIKEPEEPKCVHIRSRSIRGGKCMPPGDRGACEHPSSSQGSE
jgi:hypothetical protein